MTFLADENIPASLVRALADDYHDVVEVRTIASGISDMEVMRIAHEESRIILTFDKDFGEIAVPKIFLFRLRCDEMENTRIGRDLHGGCPGISNETDSSSPLKYRRCRFFPYPLMKNLAHSPA